MLVRRLAILLGFAAAGTLSLTIVVDDADPRIQYSGSWAQSTGVDSKEFWSGTVTFKNTSGAVATLFFTGDSVSVYGALTPNGAYNMHSEYSVDGGPPMEFLPANEIETAVYKRQFFASGLLSLSYGPHTIVVKNLGEQFWLDAIQIDVVLPSSTTTTGASMSTQIPTGSHPSTTSLNASQTIGHVVYTPPSSMPRVAFLPPFGDSTSLPNLSPSPAKASDRTPVDGDQQSRTDVSGIVAGAAVAGVILSISVLLAWFLCRRSQSRRLHTNLPGCEVAPLATYGSSVKDDGRAGRRVPTKGRGSHASLGSRSTAHTIQADNCQSSNIPPPREVLMVHDESRIGDTSEKHPHVLIRSPLTQSPPSSIPLPAERPGGQERIRALEGTDPFGDPMVRSTPSESSTPCAMERRQSVDGGLRLAGELPGEDDPADDAISVGSTLPPPYQVYRE